jgi:proteasome lid subunit RPN8/RPN11
MMEPKEQFAVAKALRASKATMLANYHSHPESPAAPSKEDIRLALTPGVSYLIISLMDPTQPVVRSYKIDQGEVVAEEICVI